ncbi:phosphoglycerate mutase-like protein [Stereum hirsutum FP-91666 SS1]|uniref:phosphoglycerate mutase-like protein n=1 Tax=Stereum hirsutum (strain FP-91666) TaxID=721885 RepID=UPI000440C44E|nr:phosphoglycerate mutase-like protein [Stereum hirsutum FP-91666 SS1]EIM86685.1 phosphoglycerate mutase-like protein [Stereum hirsutum FP-91666 SS1]
MVNASAGLLGVLILARHGDRLEFFQDPLTYTPSETQLTPLGTVEEFQLGSFLRETYISASSPSAIAKISFPVANLDQLLVRADAAGEGSTILRSMGALTSGLFPPTPEFNITLANGTTVIGAEGGAQYIPIESVENTQDVSLNSFTNCPTFDQHTVDFYASASFAQEASSAQPFLNALSPYLNGRSTNFTNMFNIFDFVNVQNIHNATFASSLQPTFVEQAYGFANFHENGVFSDASPAGVGNVAIRTTLPSMFSSLNRIANASDPLKLALDGISYKPFISYFNLTAASADFNNNGVYEPLFGIVDYASALVLEVNDASGRYSEPFLTFKFKNGTEDPALHPVVLGRFGANTTSVPLSTFTSALEFAAINNTADWCAACNQHTVRPCASQSASRRNSYDKWRRWVTRRPAFH